MSPPILHDILHLSLEARRQGYLDTKVCGERKPLTGSSWAYRFFYLVVTQVLALFTWEKKTANKTACLRRQ